MATLQGRRSPTLLAHAEDSQWRLTESVRLVTSVECAALDVLEVAWRRAWPPFDHALGELGYFRRRIGEVMMDGER